MQLPAIIDIIEGMVLGRKEPAEVRPNLLRLREVAEAIENDLAATKAELQKRSLDAEKTALKEECYRLELNLIEAKQEIESLKAKPVESEAKKAYTRDREPDLPDAEYRVLALFKEFDSIDGPYGLEVRAGLSRQLTAYGFEELIRKGYIEMAKGITGRDGYRMTAKGRAYLGERGLL